MSYVATVEKTFQCDEHAEKHIVVIHWSPTAGLELPGPCAMTPAKKDQVAAECCLAWARVFNKRFPGFVAGINVVVKGEMS